MKLAVGFGFIFIFIFGFLEKVGKVGGCFGGYERIDPLSFSTSLFETLRS